MEEKTYTLEEVKLLCQRAWDAGYNAGYYENYDEDSTTYEDWEKEEDELQINE